MSVECIRYKTTKTFARLREVKYRDSVTASMIYDELAMIGISFPIAEKTIWEQYVEFEGAFAK